MTTGKAPWAAAAVIIAFFIMIAVIAVACSDGCAGSTPISVTTTHDGATTTICRNP